jgi:hypothetical protein
LLVAILPKREEYGMSGMRAKIYGLDPHYDLTRFDAVEVHPVRAVGASPNIVEQCEEHEAHWWSVYLHFDPKNPDNEGFGGVDCVADFPTRETAEAYRECLAMLLRFQAFKGPKVSAEKLEEIVELDIEEAERQELFKYAYRYRTMFYKQNPEILALRLKELEDEDA